MFEPIKKEKPVLGYRWEHSDTQVSVTIEGNSLSHGGINYHRQRKKNEFLYMRVGGNFLTLVGGLPYLYRRWMPLNKVWELGKILSHWVYLPDSRNGFSRGDDTPSPNCWYQIPSSWCQDLVAHTPSIRDCSFCRVVAYHDSWRSLPKPRALLGLGLCLACSTDWPGVPLGSEFYSARSSIRPSALLVPELNSA